MINRLIKIADFLDSHGLEEDASFMTGILVAYKTAQDIGALDGINQEHDYTQEIEVPDEELELLRQVFSALGESLGEKGEGK